MIYREVQEEDRRLAVLQVLDSSIGYRCNAPLLREIVYLLGHDISADRMLMDIGWLQEEGLVDHGSVGGIVIVKLTERGLDVAAGRATCPGVRRPRPSEADELVGAP